MAYIPGFSGAAFGAGLQRDVRTTQEDQARKARELKRYQSKRGAMGKYGGMLAGAAAGALLTPVLGPGGVMVGKALASGLGSAAGSSKFLSGKGPSMEPEVNTGLLGSTYRQLGEAKGGIDEAMRGQAFGAGAASLASGLASKGGEALGKRFSTAVSEKMGDWQPTQGFGMDLKSAYGKRMAERGINIGGELPQAAKVMDFPGFGDVDTGSKIFDPSTVFKGRGFMPPEFLPGFTGPLSPTQQAGKSLYESGGFGLQQGGYMPMYQQGGYMPMYQMGGYMPMYQDGGLAESPELAAMLEAEAKKNPEWTKALASVSDLPDIRSSLTDVQRAAGEKGSGMTTSLINTLDPETQAMFVDYMEGTDKKGFEESYIRTPEGQMWTGGRQYHGGLTAPIKNLYSRLRGPRQVESIPSQYILPEGKQMGGMMPGGVSNPLPYQEGGYMPRYNLGGSVTQQPMAYQLGGLLKYRRSPFG